VTDYYATEKSIHPSPEEIRYFAIKHKGKIKKMELEFNPAIPLEKVIEEIKKLDESNLINEFDGIKRIIIKKKEIRIKL